jgi:hypothetical protein
MNGCSLPFLLREIVGEWRNWQTQTAWPRPSLTAHPGSNPGSSTPMTHLERRYVLGTELAYFDSKHPQKTCCPICQTKGDWSVQEKWGYLIGEGLKEAPRLDVWICQACHFVALRSPVAKLPVGVILGEGT